MRETLENNAGLIHIDFLCQGKEHRVGISSDYSKQRGFFDTVFYLDDQEYDTLEGFLAMASIGGESFPHISEQVEILKVDDGHPTHYLLFRDYAV